MTAPFYNKAPDSERWTDFSRSRKQWGTRADPQEKGIIAAGGCGEINGGRHAGPRKRTAYVNPRRP